MQVFNLEAGVRRALIAYLKERGLPANNAETLADQRLATATAYIRGAYEDRKKAPPPYPGIEVPDARHWASAFQDLKTWSVTNVV
jgi:hypothetical protein